MEVLIRLGENRIELESGHVGFVTLIRTSARGQAKKTTRFLSADFN